MQTVFKARVLQQIQSSRSIIEHESCKEYSEFIDDVYIHFLDYLQDEEVSLYIQEEDYAKAKGRFSMTHHTRYAFASVISDIMSKAKYEEYCNIDFVRSYLTFESGELIDICSSHLGKSSIRKLKEGDSHDYNYDSFSSTFHKRLRLFKEYQLLTDWDTTCYYLQQIFEYALAFNRTDEDTYYYLQNMIVDLLIALSDSEKTGVMFGYLFETMNKYHRYTMNVQPSNKEAFQGVVEFYNAMLEENESPIVNLILLYNGRPLPEGIDMAEYAKEQITNFYNNDKYALEGLSICKTIYELVVDGMTER